MVAVDKLKHPRTLRQTRFASPNTLNDYDLLLRRLLLCLFASPLISSPFLADAIFFLCVMLDAIILDY